MDFLQVYWKQLSKLQVNEMNEIRKLLRTLPEGTLVSRKSTFYHRLHGKDTGVTRNKALLRDLALCAYLKERLSRLQFNHTAKSPDRYQSLNFHDIKQSLGKAYQKLPDHYFFHPNYQKWLETPYPHNPHYPDGLKYKTNNGLLVRSKSEKIIADLLDLLNIPYHYEPEYTILEKVVYPDFIILHPTTGEEIIWEHFGLLSQKDYREQAARKLSFYMEANYFVGKNLILTYEEDIANIDALQKIIFFYLFS